MKGIKKLHRLQFGISFSARAFLIAALCLILLLFANSQAGADGPVIVGPQIDIYVGPGTQEGTLYQGAPHSFVAFDSIHNRFLVVWDDERVYAERDIYGQMINADGALYGNPITISAPSGSQQMGPMPVFDPITERFLVIWNDTRGGVWGQFVNSEGSLWRDNFSIFSEYAGGSFIVFDSVNNQFLVLWASGPGTPYNLFARFVNADGTPRSPFQITNYADGYGLSSYAAAFDSNNARFLVMNSKGFDDHLYGRLLNADGTSYGAEFAIPAAGLGSVTFDPLNSRFLITWGNGNGVRGQLVNADSTLYGGEFVIADYPAISYSTIFDSANGKFLIVGGKDSGQPIFGQFLNPDGSLSGSRFTILNVGYHGPIWPFAAFGSGEIGSLVIWSDLPYAETGYDILGKFVRLSVACRVTNTNDSGPGSLRQCLLDAQSGDTITFDPSVFFPGSPAAIGLVSALPDITTDNLTIDGSTAGVILDGSGTPAGSNGLVIDGASNVVIKGLQILNFPETGIVLQNGAQNNTIGGDTPGERNLISSNSGNGVVISGLGTMNNTVSGNYIGTDVSGTSALPNSGEGVDIGNGASNNRIGLSNATPGGACTGQCNLISGNGNIGVSLNDSETMNNTVSGNYIGVDVNGVTALGNVSNGVLIGGGVHGNVIGGTAAGERNLISGSQTNQGIHIMGGQHNRIIGNFIGMDASGAVALGNHYNGILISHGAQDNLIGGDIAAERNLISGNNDDGVGIDGADTMSNTVSGNYIGTNITGATLIPNGGSGVRVGNGAQNNLIGGSNATPGSSCTGECNLISGNSGDGVALRGSSTMSNTVSGNYIGTNVTGTVGLGNGEFDDGVSLRSGPTYNIIGGNTPGERNLLSGNGDNGVKLDGVETKYNIVIGNYIGTNASGTAAIGNVEDGAAFQGGANYNRLGGNTAAERNLISGNGETGVNIRNGSTSNIIIGNYIGTNASGTTGLGNTTDGILLTASSGNTIGGRTSGAGNLIAFNTGNGVAVEFTSLGNTFLSNSIFANGGLGIDLDRNGITPNDPGDGDTGPNNLQNFPVLTSAETGGGDTLISVTFNSLPNTTYTFEFFANNACDPSNYGEGAAFLTAVTRTTNNSGNVSFTVFSPTPVPLGHFITATAIDPNGNTSEFSWCVLVQAQVLDGQVGTGGGTVVDTAGTSAAFSVQPGVVPAQTGVFIKLISESGASPPSSFLGLATALVNITLEPNPNSLPAPGADITLPLTIPLAPNTPLILFKYDPATNTIIDTGKVGLVDTGGATATFKGVTKFSTFVGASKPPIYLPIIKK